MRLAEAVFVFPDFAEEVTSACLVRPLSYFQGYTCHQISFQALAYCEAEMYGLSATYGSLYHQLIPLRGH